LWFCSFSKCWGFMMLAEILKNLRDGVYILLSWINVTTNRMGRGSFKQKLPHSSSHKHKTCTTLTSPQNSIFKLKKTLDIIESFTRFFNIYSFSQEKSLLFLTTNLMLRILFVQIFPWQLSLLRELQLQFFLYKESSHWIWIFPTSSFFVFQCPYLRAGTMLSVTDKSAPFFFVHVVSQQVWFVFYFRTMTMLSAWRTMIGLLEKWS